ncbi:MAG: hypothetical protein ACRC9U_02920 [Metamycoplasmataceae bacterium]
MNKKILFSIGTLTTISIVTPLLTTISCTSPNPVVDIVITPKTQPRLTSEDIVVLKGTNYTAQLPVLNKLFGGRDLTSSNQPNFKISVDTDKKIVTLVANQGFTINKQPSLNSSTYILLPPQIVDLKIKANQKQTLTQKEVDELKSTDPIKQLPILQKLFSGITTENQSNFKSEINNSNVVTLTANEGFSFGGEKTISSPAFEIELPPVDKNLNITAIATAASLTKEEESALSGTDMSMQLNILGKLFTGSDLNSANQINFAVSVDTTKRIVTLTGKNDYTISGNKTLNSTQYNITTNNIVLNITKITSPKLLNSDITILEGTNTTDQLPVLKKLFNGIDNTNIAHITFKLDKNKSTVTLTANTGYVFDQSSTTLESDKYTIEPAPNINLEITKVNNPVLLSTDIDILKAKDLPAQLVALKKLFGGSGLIAENQPHFTIAVDEAQKTVTLKANSGYTINNAAEFKSNAYTIEPISLTIAKIAGAITISERDINNLEGTEPTLKLASLAKLFNGADLKAENLNKFTITVDKTNLVVVLKANDGYIFNKTEQSITSNKYTLEKPPPVIVNLTITAKPAGAVLSLAEIADLESTDKAKQLVVLQKLFEGADLKKENQDKFTVIVNKNDRIVSLMAKDGYTIDNKTLLPSNKYENEVISLTITKKPTPTITESDIAALKGNNDTNKLASLNKLFGGTDIDKIANFTIEVNETNRIVTLKPISGYSINGANTFASDVYTLSLNITAKSGTLTILQIDIDNLNGNDKAKKLESLNKLFEGADLKIENIDKLKIAVDTGNKKVTLTPIEGYSIGGATSLVSNVYTIDPVIVNLDITKQTGNIILTETDLTNLTGSNNDKKLESLKKLFGGNDLKIDNIGKFTIESNTTNRTVTLKPIANHTIGGANELVSNPYKILISITINTTAATLSEDEEKALKGTDLNAKLSPLQKMFNGIDANNIKNLDIVVGDNKVVTLNAKEGYTFESGTTLAAPAYTVTPTIINLDIQAKTGTIFITEGDIAILEGDNIPAKLDPLQKLFQGTGLSSTTLNNFTITINKQDRKVKLTAKDNYTINNTNALESEVYTIDLQITLKEKPELTASDLIDIEGSDVAKQLTALKKLFDGLDDTKQTHFDVLLDKANKKVKLTAKPGYSFVGKNFIDSNAYTITTIDLGITVKSNVTLTGYDLINLESTDKSKQLIVLKKLFDGVDDTKQNNFTFLLETTSNIVKLTAKIEYSFGGNDSISSNIFILHKSLVNLIPNSNPVTLTEAEHKILIEPTTDANRFSQLELIRRKNLFIYMAVDKYDYFNYSVNERIVTLEAKRGFAFGVPPSAGTPTITSLPYKLDSDGSDGIHLDITVLNPPNFGNAGFTYTDISQITGSDNNNKVKALSKYFSGVNGWNINLFDCEVKEVDDNNGKIELKTKGNWLFGTAGNNPTNTLTTGNLRVIGYEQPNNFIPVTVATTNPAALSQSELDILSGKDINAQFNILDKRFFYIHNISNMYRMTIRVDVQNKKIILRTNIGTYFGDSNIPSDHYRELVAPYSLS